MNTSGSKTSEHNIFKLNYKESVSIQSMRK